MHDANLWAVRLVALLLAHVGLAELHQSTFCQRGSVSTQFTGIGAVEHALQHLTAAAAAHGLDAWWPVLAGCEKETDCQEHMLRNSDPG